MGWGKGGWRGEKEHESIGQRQSAELSCYAFTLGIGGEGLQAAGRRRTAGSMEPLQRLQAMN